MPGTMLKVYMDYFISLSAAPHQVLVITVFCAPSYLEPGWLCFSTPLLMAGPCDSFDQRSMNESDMHHF